MQHIIEILIDIVFYKPLIQYLILETLSRSFYIMSISLLKRALWQSILSLLLSQCDVWNKWLVDINLAKVWRLKGQPPYNALLVSIIMSGWKPVSFSTSKRNFLHHEIWNHNFVVTCIKFVILCLCNAKIEWSRFLIWTCSESTMRHIKIRQNASSQTDQLSVGI